VRVVPLRTEGVRTVRTPLLLVLSAVGIVLLIAATNVASLLLARSVQRRRETAIRAAMGGSRWRIMRPALAEAVVVIAAGLALGLALAWLGVRTIGTLAAQRLPQLEGLGVDLRVVAFAVVLSAIVAVLCGALPAWRISAVDPQEALSAGRGGGAGRGHHRALRALVVGEVALSLVLLIGAGLVLRGFARLLDNAPGFDPNPVLTMDVTINGERYPDGSSVRRFLEPALEAVRRVPGVAEAAAISVVPYEDWGRNFNIRYEGQPGDDPTRLPLTESRTVTPGFFGVTEQRLLAGRLLTPADDERPEAPVVVVVNEALARRDFAGRDPVGQRFHTGDSSFATIVGVVSDIRNFGPVEAPRPEVYYAFLQGGRGSSAFPLMVRVQGAAATSVAAAVQRAIRTVEPGAAVTDVRPMTEVIAESVGRPRFYLTLLGVFAAIAAVLAVAGLYGVMSYAVAQRTREFGIRSALGSDVRRTVAHVTGEGARLIALGVLIGLAGGYATTRLLESLLYGVSPLDPRAWALATLLLASVGLLAAVLPAARAARVDPVVAMQAE
jgi:predicted permease